MRAVVAPERPDPALVAELAITGAEHPDTLLTWNAPGFVLSGVPLAAELLTKPYRGGWMPAWVRAEASPAELTLAYDPRASDSVALPRGG